MPKTASRSTITSSLGQFTSGGVPWTARIVFEGGAYGLDDILVHDRTDPLIEFYDARWTDGGFNPERGQFVSRYFLSTLMENSYGGPFGSDDYPGIDLDGGVSDWKLDAATCQAIARWVRDSIELREEISA